ncbi:hypothetical protein TNCV_4161321 [Trichonephila clavipes]|nr:hypothetical protein TNCV_4161321 [Trichonephila clavipes]
MVRSSEMAISGHLIKEKALQPAEKHNEKDFSASKGFQECDEEDVEPWMVCDAEECGFLKLKDDEIVASMQEESDPVDDETDEDDDTNNSESSKDPSNADAFSALKTTLKWCEQQSESCPTQLLLLKKKKNQRPYSEKIRCTTELETSQTSRSFTWEVSSADTLILIFEGKSNFDLSLSSRQRGDRRSSHANLRVQSPSREGGLAPIAEQ